MLHIGVSPRRHQRRSRRPRSCAARPARVVVLSSTSARIRAKLRQGSNDDRLDHFTGPVPGCAGGAFRPRRGWRRRGDFVVDHRVWSSAGGVPRSRPLTTAKQTARTNAAASKGSAIKRAKLWMPPSNACVRLDRLAPCGHSCTSLRSASRLRSASGLGDTLPDTAFTNASSRL